MINYKLIKYYRIKILEKTNRGSKKLPMRIVVLKFINKYY